MSDFKDLQRFKRLFGCEVARETKDSLEYRLKGDLDLLKENAKQIIEYHKLNVRVSSVGNMAQMNTFQVVALEKAILRMVEADTEVFVKGLERDTKRINDRIENEALKMCNGGIPVKIKKS